jgi:hypothetical protein
VFAVFFDEGFRRDKTWVVCVLSVMEKYGFEWREIRQALSASSRPL